MTSHICHTLHTSHMRHNGSTLHTWATLHTCATLCTCATSSFDLLRRYKQINSAYKMDYTKQTVKELRNIARETGLVGLAEIIKTSRSESAITYTHVLL